MTLDAFLSRYYRASERRASPRTVSLETRADGGGTLEQAQHADAAYLWALAIMGTVERRLSASHLEVLRGYYLSLTPAHVSIVEQRMSGRVVVGTLRPGDCPLPAADLQSMCDWSTLAAAVGLRGRFRACEARRLWHEGRDQVRLEMEARGIIGAEGEPPTA